MTFIGQNRSSLKNGTPSVEEETGVWYCRRMVNEFSKAEKCSEAGRLGGGNPALKKENIQKPETRTHISLKVAFKGQFDDFWSVYPKKIGKPKPSQHT